MINELSNSLSNVKHEQEYMEVRERIHRASKLLIILIRILNLTNRFLIKLMIIQIQELFYGHFLKLLFY